MDDLLTRTVALLERHADPAVDTRAVISRLLARPAHDPVGATYLTCAREYQ